MNEKKKKIIETSISLFAEKGFYSTSIQEIVDKSDLSKGSFYLHFRSKDELMLRIFEYYYELMNGKIAGVRRENLTPRESFIKQLEVQLEEIIKHKDFIITQFREQTISLNQELFEFIKNKDMEMKQWYESNLLAIYGDKAADYIVDLSLVAEGMLTTYLQMIVKYNADIDLHKLAVFVIRRMDDIAEGLLSGQEEPLISKDELRPIMEKQNAPCNTVKQKAEKKLLEMQGEIGGLRLGTEQSRELHGAIDLLLAEIKKAEPRKFLIQGLLANFKDISSLEKQREDIAGLLDIPLI
ncbi:TetR/AcrR family transcriptional regulator [Sediminibacillus albus]|uniref:TetR/AcrR family transcriptional regulator n=1 Tax=Sediminibacillus albus TaxID=407036 RepID=UPI0015882139|nr:TetR/AcrR family transcriptional regulator [Sediminibacillus albus]